MRIQQQNDFELIKEHLVEALLASFDVHESLGVDGEALQEKNQFGDMALKVDIEAEKVILNYLRGKNVPIKVLSEEHGTTIIGSDPKYLGILDGLDGSYVYKRARGKGRYGTMFGIFKSINPVYEDYITTGIMEHSTGTLYLAVKNSGAVMINGGKKSNIHTNDNTTLDKTTKIYIDEYFETNRETFSKKLEDFNTHYLQASSAYYMCVAEGEASFALECTRKNNLEIAVAYGLIKEAGGVMVDIQGNSIGDKKYMEFGQTEHLPIITAANKKLADAMLQYLKNKSV